MVNMGFMLQLDSLTLWFRKHCGSILDVPCSIMENSSCRSLISDAPRGCRSILRRFSIHRESHRPPFNCITKDGAGGAMSDQQTMQFFRPSTMRRVHSMAASILQLSKMMCFLKTSSCALHNFKPVKCLHLTLLGKCMWLWFVVGIRKASVPCSTRQANNTRYQQVNKRPTSLIHTMFHSGIQWSLRPSYLWLVQCPLNNKEPEHDPKIRLTSWTFDDPDNCFYHDPSMTILIISVD